MENIDKYLMNFCSGSFLKGMSTYGIRMLVTQKGRENLPLLSSFLLMFGIGHIEKHSKNNVFTFVVSG